MRLWPSHYPVQYDAIAEFGPGPSAKKCPGHVLQAVVVELIIWAASTCKTRRSWLLCPAKEAGS